MKAFLAALAEVLLSTPGGAGADPQSSSERAQTSASKDVTAVSSAPLPEVTIEAQRAAIARRVSTLLFHITAKTFDFVALWRTPICPLVAGLPRDWGEFVLARISEVAAAGGRASGPKGVSAKFLRSRHDSAGGVAEDLVCTRLRNLWRCLAKDRAGIRQYTAARADLVQHRSCRRR